MLKLALVFSLVLTMSSAFAKNASKGKGGSIKGADCKWLFDDVLKTCASMGEGCDSITMDAGFFPMAYVRPYVALQENKKFRDKDFMKACADACTSGKSPNFSDFQKNVCQ